MHHCSQCNACCIKYDHHCGMVMNCIGVNNYHLFLQMILFVFLNMTYGLGLNLYYNFYVDFKASAELVGWNCLFVVAPAFLVAVVQIGAIYYAYSMGSWYVDMATRNMNAIEETIASTLYNKSDAVGLTGKKVENCCKPKTEKVKTDKDNNHMEITTDDLSGWNNFTAPSQRVWMYTKSSTIDNIVLMLQIKTSWIPAFLPIPYDFFKAIRSFETGVTNTDPSLFMIWDSDSVKKLANLEYSIEK